MRNRKEGRKKTQERERERERKKKKEKVRKGAEKRLKRNKGRHSKISKSVLFRGQKQVFY